MSLKAPIIAIQGAVCRAESRRSMPRSRTSPLVALSMLSGALALSCAAVVEPEEVFEASEALVSIPAKGTASTLDIGEWNLEWFGATGNGPTDEPLQVSNARDVIAGADLDLWGMEEIVSAASWNELKSQLPGYAGVLANDPMVTSGSAYYTSGEQKVGLLYKTSVATVHSAKIILTASDVDFGTRPPLEVSLTVNIGGVPADLIVIVLHAKAFSDTTSYNRRKNASIALKAYLDSTYLTQKVIVIGDFNDDVDTSISAGKASPYKNFVDDAGDYFFPTKALSDAGQRSTASHTQMIDHHLVTNELQALYVPASAEVYRVDQYIAGYSSTTSDHFPVLTRYSLGAMPPPAVGKPVLNEILANEPGSDTAGEHIEIRNVAAGAADLGGWTLSDATGARHLFPAGTTLAPGAALVVFASASAIPAGLSNAVASSSGALSLGNGGDTVTLKDEGGVVVDSFTYPSSLASADGVSMNRSPDGSASGTFVLHSALSASASSPGRRVDGTIFGL